MRKTFFIGDVHGCYDELVDLLLLMSPSETDRVIFVGDMINKGPKSKEVIALIRERKYEAIKGNHEIAYIEQSFASLVQIRATLSDDEHTFIENLPYYIDDPKFLAVHAGLAPSIDIAEQSVSTFAYVTTWNKEQGRMDKNSPTPWHDFYDGDKMVIYGHWAKQGLRKKSNSIGLDTGCCYWGHLTWYCLETWEVWQVRAKHLYVPMDGNPNFVIRSCD